MQQSAKKVGTVETDQSQRYARRYPEVARYRVPVSTSVSPDVFEDERSKVFRRAWLNVGRVEEVAEPGDFLVKDLEVLKVSIIVVRGRDEKIRAFHNVCRHRGTRVLDAAVQCGTAKGFSCPFHGWTYDLEGKLAVRPDEAQFYEHDRDRYSLAPVALEVWEGFIFVSLEPVEGLREWLGEIWGLFGGYFERLRCFAHTGAEFKVNWKVAQDAFQEGYHVPTVHGRTLPEAITPEINQMCHPLEIELFRRHRWLTFGSNPMYEPTPVEKILQAAVQQPIFPALPTGKLEGLPPGINRARHPQWGFDIYVVFPTFFLGPWANGMVLTYNFWPLDVERTRWEMNLYLPAPKNAAERLMQEKAKAMTLSVVREDLSTLESTQAALASGAVSELTLSDQEIAIRHAHKVIQEIMEPPAALEESKIPSK